MRLLWHLRVLHRDYPGLGRPDLWGDHRDLEYHHLAGE